MLAIEVVMVVHLMVGLVEEVVMVGHLMVVLVEVVMVVHLVVEAVVDMEGTKTKMNVAPTVHHQGKMDLPNVGHLSLLADLSSMADHSRVIISR